MASMFLGSFPVASSVNSIGRSTRSKKCAESYHATSYITKASWNKTEKIQHEYATMRHRQNNLKHNYGGTERVSTCEDCARNCVVSAASGESFESHEAQHHSPESLWGSIKHFCDAFYRFCRPHVITGTAINIIVMSSLALEKSSDISPKFFIGLFQAMVTIISMNLYASGLNQLTDIEIDKINKPYLPLASGEYSVGTGVAIVTFCAILMALMSYLVTGLTHKMSLGLGWIVGSPALFWTSVAYFVMGTVYTINLPLLRWKRYPALAAFCFFIIRGLMFHVAFFLHIQTHVFKRPMMIPKSVMFGTVFMSFFYVIIALFKDIPDIEGDKEHGVKSLTLRLGQKRVFWICVSLLLMAYGAAIVVGATSPFLWSKLITVSGHALIASIFWNRAKAVDLKSHDEITSLYMFMWKLFYVEYFMIPLIR